MSRYPKCHKAVKANILFLAQFQFESQLQRCIWFLDPDTRPIDEDEVDEASELKAFECLEFVSDPVCFEINDLTLRVGFGGDMADDAMLDDEIQSLMQGTIELGALSCQFAQVYECGISLYSWVENQAQMLIDTDWLDSELDAEYLPGA
ncbi:MAG: hypothetical protein GY694_03435, partial [Gammaproteobacteria bacterium]|nr:hypothetical protein [Gammaproteobacteria bacterium]